MEANTVSNTWTAYFPDNTRVSGPISLTGQPHATDSDATQITDRNGNTLNITGNCAIGAACTEQLTDAQGRRVVIQYSSNAGGTWTDTITWPGPNNANVTTNVNWQTATPYALPYYCQATPTGATNTAASCNLTQTSSVVTSVQLPQPAANGNSVIFQTYYGPLDTNNYSWGELHALTMCTGTGPSSCQAQWTVQYRYQLDALASLLSTPQQPASQRPPGTSVNPVSSKTLTYVESLLSGTQNLTETTSYAVPVPSSAYSYPVVSSGTPPIASSSVTYPDGSYSNIFTANLCPSNLRSRDLCVAVPYKILNRDGSTSEMKWTSNTLAPGVPAGALFNPYVQYRVDTAPGASVSKVSFAQQDQNGNTTSITEYDWAPSSAISRDLNTNVLTTVCASGCTTVRPTTTTYNGTGNNYWDHSAPANLRSPQSVTIADAGTNIVTNYFYDNALTTANLTQVQRVGAAGATTINTYATYLSNGNVSSVTDPNSYKTLICYDSNNLYPITRVVAANPASSCPNPTALAEGRKTSYNFDFGSGVERSETDNDNSVTTTYTYDNAGRQTKIEQSAPGLRRATTTSYDDVNLVVTTTQDDAAAPLVTTTNLDALGRPRLIVDPAGNKVQKAYRYGTGGLSYELTSNPYTTTSDTTMGWTLTTRQLNTPSSLPTKTTVTSYSGNVLPSPWGVNTNPTLTGTVSTTYNVLAPGNVTGCAGIATTTTDAAGNTRTNCVDGLGRLTAVVEPDGNSTQHSYDARGNLKQVSMNGQIRAFEYDSLDRLTRACNPESATATCSTSPLASSGLEQYTYDANGNPLTKQDARGVTTTFTGYDALNRPHGKTYTDGTPAVTYSYDQAGDLKGTLSSVSVTINSSVYSTAYTHDGFGRINSSTQTTAGQPYKFTYQYSLSDRLSQIQYPSGRIVKYNPDSAGRIASVQNGTSANYATLTYTAPGGISTLTMGNGITEQLSWNDRLQVTGLNTGSALTLGLYPCTGTVTNCQTGNNGILRTQTITVPSLNATQTYSYDNVDRLTQASESGTGTWNEGYRYDDSSGKKYGNRWVDPSTRTGLPALTLETPQGTNWYSANNRISTWTNDSAGNVQSVASMSRSFTYDAENRQLTATISGVTFNYTYDGDGRRVQKSVNGVVTTYVYDASDEVAAEYSTQPNAGICSTATCYVTVDHLGSTRMVTGDVGKVLRRYDYAPFGVELLAGTGGRTTDMGYQCVLNSSNQCTPDDFNPKFTGQMRDQETGLDYFNARYYSPAQGRFTSVDPANAGASVADPQTWNGYAYVNNNPLTLTDPSGEGIFGAILGIVGGALGGPWGYRLGAAAGNTIDAAIWGPDSTKFSTLPDIAGGLTACGGPLGNCGSLGSGPWSENSGLGTVQDPGRFVFSERPADQSVADYYVENYIAGLTDSFSFGWTRRTRTQRGLKDADYCSAVYQAGEWTPVVLGGLRLAYAGQRRPSP